MKKERKVYLISNGDYRDSANIKTWAKQEETLRSLRAAFRKLGVSAEVITKYDAKRKHGFLTKQCEGTAAFSKIEPDAPVVIVLSVWAYSHHVAGPLMTHKGPILLLANFDGTYPGLVALLNHSATLDRLNVKHSRIWTEDFAKDDVFMGRLAEWLKGGSIKYSTAHLTDGNRVKLSAAARKLGKELAADILKERRVMGQFDPGCMGMLNAVIDPAKLGAVGMPIEYLNQSDLLAEMKLVSDEEAQQHLNWLVRKGCRFVWGYDMFEHLVHAQVLSQMKMYSAACRIYQRYGLSSVGIPYQYGLVRSVPASDLVEGMLNNADRPNVVDPDTRQVVNKGKPIPHFNEGDMGSGVPQVLMSEIYQRKGMPAETTLHDVRWGREFNGQFVWVFLISGGAPAAHFGGWKKTTVYRQNAMYFPLGGGTCTGVSKPGTITWARFYEAYGKLGMDCGTGEVVELPEEDLQDRLAKTNPEWPIASVVIPGYGRDELMSSHMSNHITIGYGNILEELVATCQALGIPVRVAGDAGKALK
ncbi:MAG TPA: fucose isomerase [Candidatus Hydrogenedentes bacterium]|nr:fucose isomerase [Candidatus Hydrogenedentota bacterium]HPG67044.1 fucose isomerase [Candidatus Hydrogenedentota bacterium]